MKTISSLNRTAMNRARKGLNLSMTLKKVKVPSMSKGKRLGK